MLPHRLRRNFRLSIISLLGACALLGITPFAIWRFAQGHWALGVIDSAILAGVVGAVVYAWRTDDTARAGLLLTHIICGGAATVATLLGEVGLFWMYPALITSFFLTQAWVATYIAVLSVGFLLVHGRAFISHEHMFTFAATTIVVSACAYVFALRNERQRDQLQHLANRDPLTGVKNRRAMDDELATAIASHDRHGTPYGLALVDLDHFKAINDLQGHSTGDAILMEFARLLEANTRRTDQVFRFGGEEFVLLLPGVDQVQLQKALENVQAVLRQHLKSPSGAVTASFGTTVLRAQDDADSWLGRADRALYAAKHNGRDQIVAAEAAALD